MSTLTLAGFIVGILSVVFGTFASLALFLNTKEGSIKPKVYKLGENWDGRSFLFSATQETDLALKPYIREDDFMMTKTKNNLGGVVDGNW